MESKPFDSQNTPSQVSHDHERAAKISDYNTVSIFSNPSTVTINQILGHVFRRPYLSIPPEIPFLELGTFLATGYQINVDGLIVAIDKKLVGRISGKHILDHLLKMNYDDWSSVRASDLMDSNTSSVEMESSLNSLLKLFAETNFALAPITNKSSLIGSIVIRDILPLICRLNLDTPVKMVGSPIVRISMNESIKNSIDLMLKKKIRNLVVSKTGDHSNNNDNYIVNDRMILEFIFSYEGRKILYQGLGATALDSVSLNSLNMTAASSVSENQIISKTATMLRDINTPALLLKNHIVTPWDIVMKTIGKEYLVNV
jgi:predicted transcriptional regulator